MSSKIIGNVNNDLTMILKSANEITLDDLEFDKLFKEQKTILCDIRNILKKTNNMDNNLATCDTNTNLDDFKTTYNQLKNKYSLTGDINKMNMKTKINKIKNKLNSGKTISSTRTKKNIYPLTAQGFKNPYIVGYTDSGENLKVSTYIPSQRIGVKTPIGRLRDSVGKNKSTTTSNSGHVNISVRKNRQKSKNGRKSLVLKSSNKLNTRYPVVLINKSTPTKNLFYVNIDKKKKK